MRKRFYFLFMLFLILVFCEEVHAVEVGVKNDCSDQDVSKSLSCGDTTLDFGISGNPITTSDTILVPTSDPKPGNVEDIVYDIRILVDNSTSMLAAGYNSKDGKSKMQTLNQIFKNFVNLIRNQYPKSTIQYKLFTDTDFKSYTSDNDVLNEKLLDGNTTIQKNLQQAYQSLKNSKNIPLVVLFTDGYPNVTCPGQNLNDTCSKSDSTTFAIKHFYYTMEIMKSLKRELITINKDAMIVTFGVGMNKDDSLAKYFLKPSIEHYNGLASTTTNSTAANVLHEVLNGKQYTGVDFRAYLFNGGFYGFPEYGLFKGEVDQTGKVVTFTMNVTKQFSDMWGTKQENVKERMFFFFPNLSQKTFTNNLKSVTFKFKGETDWVTFDKNKLGYNSGNLTLKKENIPSKLRSKLESLEQVKFTFKNAITFNTWTTGDKFISYTDLNNVVDYSAIGELGDLESVLGQIRFAQPEPSTELKYTSHTYNYSKYESTSCKSYDNGVTISAYVKMSEDIYKTGTNISLNNCGPVQLTVPVIMTEDLNFQFNGLYNINDTTGSKKNVIYAGGGFAWYGATLSNKIYWLYKYLSRNSTNNQMFSVKYDFAVRSDNGYVKYSDDRNFDNSYSLLDLNELDLYTDSTCRTKLTSNVLDSEVGKILLNNKISDTSVSFISVDSNDANLLNSTLPVKTSSEQSSSVFLPSDSSSGLRRAIEFKETFSLPMAYINVSNARVDYNSALHGNPSYVAGGELHYVPLDYFDSTVSIKINNTSVLSRIGNNTILDSDSAACFIGVQQILYESPGNGSNNKKMNYNYRSIDVDNPFPRSSSPGYKYPENWADWYAKDSNQRRIRNSYSNYPTKPLYSIVFNKEQQGDIASIGTPYTDWSGMLSNGISQFVQERFGSLNGGTINATSSYCGLGSWKAECDRYGS